MDTLFTAGAIIGVIVFVGFLIVKAGEFFKKNERGDKIMAYGCMSILYILTILSFIGAIILGVNIGGKLGVVILVVAGLFAILLVGKEIEARKKNSKDED